MATSKVVPAADAWKNGPSYCKNVQPWVEGISLTSRMDAVGATGKGFSGRTLDQSAEYDRLQSSKGRTKERRDRRLRKFQSWLVVFLVLTISDMGYGLVVYSNFTTSKAATISKIYNNLYLTVVSLGTVATLHLIVAQAQSLIQVTRILHENRNETTNAKSQRRDLILVHLNLPADAPEFRLGENQAKIRRMRAILVCAFFEDFLNLCLVIYRVFVLPGPNTDLIRIDVFDQLAILVGTIFITYKASYVRELKESEHEVKHISEQLLGESKTLSSVLDDFEDVQHEEVDLVICVRELLKKELRRQPYHIKSDVNILRFVRGTSSIFEACKKIRAMIDFRNKNNLNMICERILSENLTMADSPHRQLLAELDCPQLNIVGLSEANNCYVNFINNMQLINEHAISTDKFRAYNAFNVEFCILLLISTSLKRKRVVSLDVVADIGKLTISGAIRMQSLTKIATEHGEESGMYLMQRQVHLVGVSSRFAKIYQVLQPVLPESLTSKFNLDSKGDMIMLQDDSLGDLNQDKANKSLLEFVGMEIFLQLFPNISHIDIEATGLLVSQFSCEICGNSFQDPRNRAMRVLRVLKKYETYNLATKVISASVDFWKTQLSRHGNENGNACSEQEKMALVSALKSRLGCVISPKLAKGKILCVKFELAKLKSDEIENMDWNEFVKSACFFVEFLELELNHMSRTKGKFLELNILLDFRPGVKKLPKKKLTKMRTLLLGFPGLCTKTIAVGMSVKQSSFWTYLAPVDVQKELNLHIVDEFDDEFTSLNSVFL